MAKSKKLNKKVAALKGRIQHNADVAWQLTLLGAQGLASYKLYHGVSGHNDYALGDYIVIIAATALAIHVIFRVAQLLTKEASWER